MSAFTKFITRAPNTIFEGPSYDQYVSDLSKARKAPTVFDYNIDANKAAGQFIQDKTKEVLGDNPVSNVLGQAATYGSIPLAVFGSPFHEAMQVVEEGRMEPGSGIKGFYNAFMNERPFKTAVERGAGVLQSTPLGEAIYNIGEKTADLVSGIRNTNIGDLFFTPTSADDDKITQAMRDEVDITDRLNINELDDDQSRLLNKRDGILENIDFGKLLSFAEILGPTNLRKALAGTRLGSTVNNLFQGRRDGLGPRSGFLERTPGYTGQLIASDQYDPITRTNRFDRAKTLFGQSRTLMDYIQKKKDERAAKAAAAAQKLSDARTAISDAGSGFDDYGAGQGAGMGFGGGRTDPTDKS